MSFRGIFSYLRSHPVVCLFLLTPGIPEYLTGSSPLNAFALNPLQFMFQLLLNAGLYLPGALLIREATIRWKKGWASILLLGAAYGILEEGIALGTLYDPLAKPVGALGYYGHWLGVSWVWTAGILLVHMIYSIALPILLLNLALPRIRGRRLLSLRQVYMSLCVLGVDVMVLFALVSFSSHFWMGWPVFVGSWLAIAALAWAAHKASADLAGARSLLPKTGPRTAFLMGLIFFTSILFPEHILMGAGVAPVAAIVVMYSLEGLLLAWILRNIGKAENERATIALSFGMLVPIAVFGFLAEFNFPMILLADLVMVLFFRMLWRRHASRQKAGGLVMV
ncbi:MAG: hypothetical protein ABSG92_08445 [Conexivisphaerales archaeon]